MILILAEKPSVAKTIASFLGANNRQEGYFEGNNYIVTYAVGHLVSLYDMKDYDKERFKGSWKIENFPFIPNDKFKFKVDKSKLKQFNIIKKLLKRNDVKSIINATDNDREGELISFLILMMSKNKKKVQRILVNEWTPEDITRGMQSLKTDEEMRNTQAAGYTRLLTDWLIGINFTSVATLKYGNGKLLNIGRVILPTVKLIYDRHMEIEKFIPKTYFEIEGSFKCKNGNYTGKFIKDKKSKFDKKENVDNIIKTITDDTGNVKYKEVKLSKEFSPKLFSLTSLQGYITSKYSSFTSDKVLSVCQSLYEGRGKGGFITYPRTDSIYLEESLAPKVEKTLNILKTKLSFSENINFSKTKRIFDSKKVSSHSAIIPTYIIPPSTLTSDESIVYKAIHDRFIANFMPPAEYENTEIKTIVNNFTFLSKGKVLKSKGYLEILGKNTKDNLLPFIEKNEIVNVLNIKAISKQTNPPKPYTEDTLLKAMKNCGKNVSDEDTAVLSGYSIGTSATRADVLKKISLVGYVTKKNKSYAITKLGINLVEIFPAKELFDVDFTGKLEKKLYDIQLGNFSRKEFLYDICKFVYNNVNLIKSDSKKYINTEKITFQSKKVNKNTIAKTQKTERINNKNIKKKPDKNTPVDQLPVIATCPICGEKILQSHKAFACKNYKNCGFIVWINDPLLIKFKKKTNKTMLKNLIKNNKTLVKGLKDQNGTKFEKNISYAVKNKKLYLYFLD